MIALDTNVLVRLLVDDDPDQTRRARKLLESRTALLLPTVLLETEWVLRGAYDIGRPAIAASLRKLLGLPNIALGNAEAVGHALEWFEAGLDFADALHLALAGEAEGFVTFDARLAALAPHIGASQSTLVREGVERVLQRRQAANFDPLRVEHGAKVQSAGSRGNDELRQELQPWSKL